MALVNCPECNKLVSNKAIQCPNCGYPINNAKNAPPSSDNNVIISKKLRIAVIVGCVLVVLIGAFFLLHNKGTMTDKASTSKETIVEVNEISISKWVLTQSTDYGDYYDVTVTSNQKEPFVAVIERGNGWKYFVYLEDGIGVFETTLSTSDDDYGKSISSNYTPIGYLTGEQVSESLFSFALTESEYNDFEGFSFSPDEMQFISETQNLTIEELEDLETPASTDYTFREQIKMNQQRTGVLVFDVVNEADGEIVKRNRVEPVVNGMASYYGYVDDLEYMSRGVDISIAPKYFIESADVPQEDYAVLSAYSVNTTEVYTGTMYDGEQKMSFTGYSDGIVLYSSILLEGGSAEGRNIAQNDYETLSNGICSFTTSDYVSNDEATGKPKYEFEVLGYIAWTEL